MNLEEYKDLFNLNNKTYWPNLTVDCSIFGYNQEKLQLLLVKNKLVTSWCLPGGYVKKTETLDEAASRITAERTNIDSLFLKQFKTFADPGRNNAFGSVDPQKYLEILGVEINETFDFQKQAVSVGFYSISNIIKATPQIDILSDECKWFPIDELPSLGFDHDEMVKEALFTMRMHLFHFPVGKKFLPKKFTLKEIKQLYEVLSGKTLNATNFPNKLIKLNLIHKLDEKKSIGAHRSPTYYKFNDKVYNKALEEGLVLV